jgi:hypothetical protein
MIFLWFYCVNLLFRNEVFLIPPPDIKQVRIRCLQTRKSSTWRISLEMSGKGKPGFPVLMPCFWGLFRWTRPGYGFRICSWTTDINPQNQPSTGTSGKDIVNDFSLRYQFDPIMIIRNQFRNVYISSWAGTPNKIWGNFQWNLVSWDFSGFKKKIKLTKRTLLSFSRSGVQTGCWNIEAMARIPNQPLCKKGQRLSKSG